MFSLHQPPAEAGNSRTNPSISFPEDGVVIDVILRLCYPVDDPAVKDLRTIARVIMAAAKYQMDEAKKLATGWLRSQLYITPLPVYAIACVFNLEAEAAAAAKAWKDMRTFNNKVFSQSVEGSSYVHQMDGMSAGSYFRLLQYIRAPARSFDTKLFSFSQPQYTSAYHHPQRREPVNRDIPDSLFPDSFTQPVDFVLMSMDGYDFKVHRLVLELAGAHKLLEHAEEISPDGLPISRINAMGWALAKVISLCYPLATWDIPRDFTAIRAVLSLATRYEISPVQCLARQQLFKSISGDPLRVYCIAAEHGWDEEVQEAARTLATIFIEDMYVPEMEDVPAKAYYHLLDYHFTCKSVIRGVLSRYSSTTEEWRKAVPSSQMIPPSVPLSIVEKEICWLLSTSDKTLKASISAKRKALDLRRNFVLAGSRMENELKSELAQVPSRFH